ncbi:MAG: hypothetical protein QOD77_171 [Thermoplasmata archaeon]|jgi:hypothetical protein|nr:hypothetical protein [Thermoplasmata archaeon]
MAAGPSSKPHAFRSVAVLTALLVAVLAPLIPQAVADGTSLSIAVGPHFEIDTSSPTFQGCPGSDATSPQLRARPDDAVVQTRTVRVFNGAAATQTQVTFRYTVAGPGAPPVDRSLTWDEEGSSAAGWTVQAINTGSTAGSFRDLVFNSGSLVPGAADFTIAFRVPTTAVGDAGTATPDLYPINVRTAGGGDFESTPQPTSFCIRVDNKAPKLTDAVTRDTDADGRIDAYVLTFDEPMDTAASAAQFEVKSVTDPSPYQPLGFRASHTFRPGAGTNLGEKTDALLDRQAVLNLAPGYSYDTGEKPDVTYPKGGAVGVIQDQAGNKLGKIVTSDVSERDGAKPVLVSAYGFDGATNIILTFSEKVSGSRADKNLALADLFYEDSLQTKNCIGATDGVSAELGEPKPSPAPAPATTFIIPVLTSRAGAGCTSVRVGDGDSHPSAGDRIKFFDTGNSCVGRDFDPCGAPVYDVASLHAVPARNAPVVVTGPFVKEAEVNIDSFQLTLRFNGPVSSARGEDQPIRLEDLDVVAADGTGQGPGGIVNVLHRPGSDKAIITLDRRTRPTDVDDTPARINIQCNAIKGTGLPSFVPCGDPDNDRSPDVNMVDHTPPAIVAAGTYDGNRDGYIDGVSLLFNEPVDDATFCIQKNVGVQPRTIAHDFGATPDNICNNLDILEIASIPGPYTFDTDKVQNDAQGIIKFPQRAPPTFKPDTSEYLPYSIKTTGDGLFADLAHPEPPTPGVEPWQTANLMLRISKDPVTCPDPNIPCATTLTVADWAPPVVLSAQTVDTKPAVKPSDIGALGSDPVPDLEGDGFLDGYRVTFSERIDDTSFNAAEWQVAGYKVTGMRTYEPHVTKKADQKALSNDTVITIQFEPSKVADTDARPELHYLGSTQARAGLDDLVGNRLLPFGSIGVNEADDAGPVIVGIAAIAGRADVTLLFSEPVDDGSHGALSRRALQYGNVNANKVAESAASGMADQDAVVHKPATRSVVITLNAPLSTGDINDDTIAAQPNSVFETSPTVQAKKVASYKPHGMDFARDGVPPGNVTASVVAPLITANSVTLQWTAPGNDGTSTLPAPARDGKTYANVTGYLVKVSSEPITPENFLSPAAPGTIAFGYSDAAAKPFTDGSRNEMELDDLVAVFNPDLGALAGPGVMQQVTVRGLKSNTLYYFAVAAFDDSAPEPQLGGIGTGTVSATTAVDPTPPIGTPVITSSTHRPDVTRPSNSKTAIFDWTPARDDESLVTYHTAVNHDPGYVATATDEMTTRLSKEVVVSTEGVWTFHVAACSGGGCGATGHYNFGVGYSPLDKQEIRVANQYVNFTAVRDDKAKSTTITWELPPEEFLPSRANLEAVVVYRLDCEPSAGCKPTEVQRVNGDYTNLKTGSVTDTSDKATLASAYRVDMVFASGQEQAESLSGFSKVRDVTPAESNLMWILIAIGAVVLLAIVGFVVYAMRRKGPGAAEAWTEDQPAGTDPTSGLPAHDVRCPSCQTAFQAVGTLPLQITCPNCGVGGLLQ